MRIVAGASASWVRHGTPQCVVAANEVDINLLVRRAARGDAPIVDISNGREDIVGRTTANQRLTVTKQAAEVLYTVMASSSRTEAVAPWRQGA